MKNSLLIITAIACSVSLFSCKKEGCTDSTAANYDSDAEKDNGSCTYTVDPRDQYTGTYLVKDTLLMNGSSSQIVTYNLQVTKATETNTILLNNLWNEGAAYKAVLSGTGFSGNVISYQTSGDIYVNKGRGPKQ